MLIGVIVTAVINSLVSNKKILGASVIVFMLILSSSLVNIENGKIPIILILIFVFYIVNEILKKDNISHMCHLIGVLCGLIFGFYWM